MKIKYIVCVMAIVAFTENSFAQYSGDAFLFSTTQPGSTARIKAIGNAATAVGGDLSSISGNPAGAGFFTHSEASFTPEFNSSGVNGSYLGQTSNASVGTLNFNNASAVFYNRLSVPRGSRQDNGWLSVNFGVSFNRTNDFYETATYTGTNKYNSISTYYADQANQGGVSPGGPNIQDMAYDNYLIDQYANGGPQYQSNVFSPKDNLGNYYNKSAPNQPVSQVGNYIRQGGQTEFSLAMGANYSNQLYLGMGIGITSLNYKLSNAFTESGTATILSSTGTPTNMTYNSVYSQNQDTKGSGFNARFGFIYKPVDAFRFGASVTTPTWYTIQDDYSNGITTKLQTGNLYARGPIDYPFTYNFHTPFKASGGMAVFFEQYGFISADFDYIDYSSINISSDTYNGYDASTDNSDIRTSLKSTFNTRVGGELKLDQVLFRAGYNVQGNPYRTGGSDTKTVSGGLGYRLEKYYVDFTYTNVQGNQTLYPYVTSSNSPQANLSQTTNNFFVTVGFRF